MFLLSEAAICRQGLGALQWQLSVTLFHCHSPVSMGGAGGGVVNLKTKSKNIFSSIFS